MERERSEKRASNSDSEARNMEEYGDDDDEEEEEEEDSSLRRRSMARLRYALG